MHFIISEKRLVGSARNHIAVTRHVTDNTNTIHRVEYLAGAVVRDTGQNPVYKHERQCVVYTKNNITHKLFRIIWKNNVTFNSLFPMLLS